MLGYSGSLRAGNGNMPAGLDYDCLNSSITIQTEKPTEKMATPMAVKSAI